MQQAHQIVKRTKPHRPITARFRRPPRPSPNGERPGKAENVSPKNSGRSPATPPKPAASPKPPTRQTAHTLKLDYYRLVHAS